MPNAEVAFAIYVANDSRRPPNDSKKFNVAGDKAVNNYLPRGESRDTNSSAVLAVYDILRRQPWKTMAITTWDTHETLSASALVAASLATHLLAHAWRRPACMTWFRPTCRSSFRSASGRSSRDAMTSSWPPGSCGNARFAQAHCGQHRHPAQDTAAGNQPQAGLQHAFENCAAHPDMGQQKTSRAWMLWEKRRLCGRCNLRRL